MVFTPECPVCKRGDKLRQWTKGDVWSCLGCGRAYVATDTGELRETQGSKVARPSYLTPTDREAAFRKKDWDRIERTRNEDNYGPETHGDS